MGGAARGGMVPHAHLPPFRRAEHIMAMPALVERHWTPDEVRELMRNSESHWPRYELIDGELVVSPAPGVPHYRALMWLFHRLLAYAMREGIGEACLSPADLELRKETISQPDIFVAPAEQVRRFRRWQDVTGVALVVEVVSPGSARNDRGRKRVHYQRSGIPEYWIVDTDSRLVERWRPADERPEILAERLVWHPEGAREALALELADLWVTAEPEG
jgi:Uma2 family endonuclease